MFVSNKIINYFITTTKKAFSGGAVLAENPEFIDLFTEETLDYDDNDDYSTDSDEHLDEDSILYTGQTFKSWEKFYYRLL